MESLVIVFVIGMFFYIIIPKAPPKKKDPWEEMGKAIGTALKTLFPAENKPDQGSKKKDDSGEFFWVLVLSGLVGAIVLFGS
jgi:hypothetical protein